MNNIQQFFGRRYALEKFSIASDNTDMALLVDKFFMQENYASSIFKWNFTIIDNLVVESSLVYGTKFNMKLVDDSTANGPIYFNGALYLIKIDKLTNEGFFGKNQRAFVLQLVDENTFKLIQKPVFVKRYDTQTLDKMLTSAFTALNPKFVLNTTAKVASYKFNYFMFHGDFIVSLNHLFNRLPLHFCQDRYGEFNVVSYKDINFKAPIKLKRDDRARGFQFDTLVNEWYYGIEETHLLNYIDEVRSHDRFDTFNYNFNGVAETIQFSDITNLNAKIKQRNYKVLSYYGTIPFDGVVISEVSPLIDETTALDYFALSKENLATLWDYEYKIYTNNFKINLFDAIEATYIPLRYQLQTIEDISQKADTVSGFVINIDHMFQKYQYGKFEYSNTLSVVSNSL